MTTKRKPKAKAKAAPKRKPRLGHATVAAAAALNAEWLKRMEAIKPKPTILEEAQALVTGDRAAAYGPPEENFVRWRNMVRATGRPSLLDITAEDLCIIMLLLKIARESGSPVRDTPVDIAGYAYCLDRVRGL